MVDEKRRPPLCAADDDLEREIERYALMPEWQVDEELAIAGINVEETLQTVHDLVQKKLEHGEIFWHEPS